MLKDLKKEIIKTRLFNLKVCPECWDPDQPQLQLGMYPVDDPQALRNPRKDNTYYQSGTTSIGSIGEGSRNIQWGWNPVGMSRGFGSRQEEAQRLGRILRPKSDGRGAIFYSVVSRDTVDQDFAQNRQRFLAEQGYSYRIIDADDVFQGKI
jgi:hypothetical protein